MESRANLVTQHRLHSTINCNSPIEFEAMINRNGTGIAK